jgi:hypothetical protein
MVRLRLLAAAAVLGALSIAGCSSDVTTQTSAPSSTVGGAGTTAPAAGYEIVPDAQVKAGLVEVRKVAAQIKTTLPSSQADATTLSKDMYKTWFTFEGTVRKNDKDLYLQMEDGLAAIKAGVDQNRPDKVDRGIADLESGATAYLAAHP